MYDLRAIAAHVHHAEAEAALIWAAGEIERLQAALYHAIPDEYETVEAFVKELVAENTAFTLEAVQARIGWAAAERELEAARAVVESKELIEALAAYSHDSAWGGWMRYQFSKGTHNEDGSWTMPAWAVERWARQMNTPYAEMPEAEKKSDRDEADKMLAIVRVAARRAGE